jgi:hypothetical protein
MIQQLPGPRPVKIPSCESLAATVPCSLRVSPYRLRRSRIDRARIARLLELDKIGLFPEFCLGDFGEPAEATDPEPSSFAARNYWKGFGTDFARPYNLFASGRNSRNGLQILRRDNLKIWYPSRRVWCKSKALSHLPFSLFVVHWQP